MPWDATAHVMLATREPYGHCSGADAVDKGRPGEEYGRVGEAPTTLRPARRRQRRTLPFGFPSFAQRPGGFPYLTVHFPATQLAGPGTAHLHIAMLHGTAVAESRASS